MPVIPLLQVFSSQLFALHRINVLCSSFSDQLVRNKTCLLHKRTRNFLYSTRLVLRAPAPLCDLCLRRYTYGCGGNLPYLFFLRDFVRCKSLRLPYKRKFSAAIVPL